MYFLYLSFSRSDVVSEGTFSLKRPETLSSLSLLTVSSLVVMRGAISHQGLSSIPKKSLCKSSHCKIQAVPFCIHTGKIWGFEAPGPVEVTHLPDTEWSRAVCSVDTMCLSAVSILLARKTLPLPGKGFICSGTEAPVVGGHRVMEENQAESRGSIFAVRGKRPHFHTQLCH